MILQTAVGQMLNHSCVSVLGNKKQQITCKMQREATKQTRRYEDIWRLFPRSFLFVSKVAPIDVANRLFRLFGRGSCQRFQICLGSPKLSCHGLAVVENWKNYDKNIPHKNQTYKNKTENNINLNKQQNFEHFKKKDPTQTQTHKI